MTSAPRAIPEPDDLTGKARLREAALRLFAERGFEGVSGRAIAREAGVSPALVAHHYGSIADLRNEVDKQVLNLFDDMMSIEEPTGSIDDLYLKAAEQVQSFFREQPIVGEYVRRLLIEGGESGYEFFRGLYRQGLAFNARLIESGLARPAMNGDEEMRLAQVMMMDLGFILLRPLISRLFDADIFSASMVERWWAAESDILSNGYLRRRPAATLEIQEEEA